tara:strand:- start:45 stop:212 length:168 start_codon:yes stop_codon:yes gene_type:complete
MKYPRILYHWVLCWAEKPFVPKALAEISFANASFLPIPKDVFLIPIDERIFQAYF